MRKAIKMIGILILALIVLVVAGGYLLFRGQLTAMGTIKKVDDRLYTMTYKGDYGFDAFLEKGGAASDAEVGDHITEFLSHGFYKVKPQTQKQGCSTVHAKGGKGGYLFGRNYDWKDCTVMVVQTKPENGYASVSTCNMDFLGFGEGYLPEGFVNKMLAISSVYVPLDGINEKGLCVADLMIDVKEETCQDTGKADLTTTTAIRLLLDHAANVREAVELLEQYDMHSSAGMMHHLAIADNEGNSVVAEYVDNELVITNTPAVTNFFFAEGEKKGIGSQQSKRRFAILENWLAQSDTATQEQMKEALQSVSQKAMGEEFEKTVWSIVYDQTSVEATYYFREDYGKSYTFPVTQ
jgi:predicted choloylglycine hydrolase